MLRTAAVWLVCIGVYLAVVRRLSLSVQQVPHPRVRSALTVTGARIRAEYSAAECRDRDM
jgi:hypothetical protein